jgi:hypothetical protein
MTLDLMNLRKALGEGSRHQMGIIWKYTVPSDTATVLFRNDNMFLSKKTIIRPPIQKL